MKKIQVGITGYSGFMGSHLVERLSREKEIKIVKIEDASFANEAELKSAIKGCDIIVHLAGMNRGDDEEVF